MTVKRPLIHKIKGACVPCAFHYVIGIDEFAVLRACKSYGWSEEEGMDDESWLKAAGLLGINLKRIPTKPIELYKVLKKYKEGLFLTVTYDHMFVVDNGIIFDPRCKKPPGLRRIIKSIWKVNK